MSSAASHFGTAKDEIRQAINIVDLVGSYLDLRRQGAGYVGLCPWHSDSKPSLQVNPARQIWKCWVCNIGGDIFSFVMQHDGVEFREALRLLADRAGIELKQFVKATPITPGSPNDKVALLAAAAWVENQFHECLLRAENAEPARRYLEDRGITPESVEKFRIGFSPENWTWLLDRARNTPHSPAVLEAIDVISKSERGYYDRFRGRLMFPIRDTQSRPIAFGGRVLPNSPDKGGKYINSRETSLFSKRKHLYALDIAKREARKTRHLTVVEGYTDVVICHQFGVNDVVACLGTALGADHIPLLRDSADSVTLLLDGDGAGQKRTNDILEEFLTVEFDLKVLTLPDEMDPADFLLEHGHEQFQYLMKAKAIDALEHKIRSETRDLDVVTETQRASIALEEVLKTLAKKATVRDIDLKNLSIRQKLSRIARAFLIDDEDVRTRFGELCNAPAQTPRPVPATKTAANLPQSRAEYRLSSISMDEVELLEILVAHNELAGTALSELGDEDLFADATKVIFRTYRHLEEAGDSLEFSRVLAEVEDTQLKSLMVQLVEVADRKASKANLDPPTRLRQLLQKIHRGHERRIIREKEEYLKLPEPNDQQKHDVFLEILEAKRRQQGLIAPTDG